MLQFLFIYILHQYLHIILSILAKSIYLSTLACISNVTIKILVTISSHESFHISINSCSHWQLLFPKLSQILPLVALRSLYLLRQFPIILCSFYFLLYQFTSLAILVSSSSITSFHHYIYLNIAVSILFICFYRPQHFLSSTIVCIRFISFYQLQQFLSFTIGLIIYNSFYRLQQYLSSTLVYIVYNSFYRLRQFLSSTIVFIF